MNILVVVAHPHTESLNHAIAGAAVDTLRRSGHEVVFHDLYEEGFDPCLPGDEIPKEGRLSPTVQRHCEELRGADGIVIVHPNWWGQPPAVLKGWVDRVFRPGIAYEFLDGDSGEGIPVGLLKANTAIVFNTSNTPEERERRVFGDPLETLWKNCIFDLCGVRNVHRRMFSVVVMSSVEQRRRWLGEVRDLVAHCFPGKGVHP